MFGNQKSPPTCRPRHDVSKWRPIPRSESLSPWFVLSDSMSDSWSFHCRVQCSFFFFFFFLSHFSLKSLPHLGGDVPLPNLVRTCCWKRPAACFCRRPRWTRALPWRWPPSRGWRFPWRSCSLPWRRRPPNGSNSKDLKRKAKTKNVLIKRGQKFCGPSLLILVRQFWYVLMFGFGGRKSAEWSGPCGAARCCQGPPVLGQDMGPMVSHRGWGCSSSLWHGHAGCRLHQFTYSIIDACEITHWAKTTVWL